MGKTVNLSTFGKFLSRYAGELSLVGSALNILLRGTAIPAKEKEEVEAAIATVLNAAESITKSLSSLSEIKVSRADLVAVVKANAPELVTLLIAEATDQITEAVLARLALTTGPAGNSVATSDTQN